MKIPLTNITLAKRIECVKKVLDFLRGVQSIILPDEISFMKIATITIIKEIVPGRKYANSDFNAAASYLGSIFTYTGNVNSLNSTQLTRVSSLFTQFSVVSTE